MVEAVPAPTGTAPVTPSGDVRTQLATAERQLADCVNCDTARTSSGQARIQNLTSRVQILKSRLEEVEKTARDTQRIPSPWGAGPKAGNESPAALGPDLAAVAGLDVIG